MSKPDFLPLTGLTGMDVNFGPTPQMLPKMLPSKELTLSSPSYKAIKFVTAWFCQGLHDIKTTPFEGVIERDALAHISTLLKSMELNHNQKMTACAQLVDMWFEEFFWNTKA